MIRLILIGLWSVGFGASCSGATPQLDPAAELKLAASFLLQAHPAVGRTVTSTALWTVAHQEATRLSGDEPRGAIEIAASFQRMLAAMRDGHLEAGLDPSAAPSSGLPVLPKRVEGRWLIDASAPELPLGTELLSVEGQPIDRLMRALADYATVDGDRPKVRLDQAERRFRTFSTLHLGQRARYRVEVREPGAPPRTLELQAVGPERLDDLPSGRHSRKFWGIPTETDLPTLHRVDDTRVILRLPSFGSTRRETFEARVASIFESLGGDEALALDLRGNAGGDRLLGVMILRHLIDRPFRQWDQLSTRIRGISEPSASRVTFPFVPEKWLSSFPGERRGDEWVVEGDPLAAEMVPINPSHFGPITVFVDEATHSAAVEMVVALLAFRDDVRVIGRETRGGCARHTGQMPILYRVPGTPVTLAMSLFEVDLVELSSCQPEQGIVPDERIEYEEAHFRQGVDPYLMWFSAG